MPAVELDQAMRADFEAWSVSAGFAYRNHQGFWFYRNGGNGMFEAYCAGAVSQRKGLEDNPCHCQKPPNAELRGAKPIGEASRSNAELGEEG